jgi:DNA polymerase (family 10)
VKVRQLVSDLGIPSIDELEKACRADKLSSIRGFSPALQRKVLEGIEMRRRGRGQHLIHHAEALLSATAANLARSHPELEQITPAGDFRRACELVHHLALVARVNGLGEIRTASANKHVELTVADEPRYGVSLLLATGSAAHVEALQSLAQRKRLSLGWEDPDPLPHRRGRLSGTRPAVHPAGAARGRRRDHARDGGPPAALGGG